MHMSGQVLAHRYHSYYTISANPIYVDPDYNSPLIYWWGYCNLSIMTMVYLSHMFPVYLKSLSCYFLEPQLSLDCCMSAYCKVHPIKRISSNLLAGTTSHFLAIIEQIMTKGSKNQS